MTENSEREKKLLEAIETEIHIRPVDDTDIEHAKDVAAYEKINSLFAGLRQPGDVPAKVGRYEIKEMIGSGAFGAVYLAHDPELDREVAIKIPHPDRFISDEDEANFVKEARSTATLSDPSIVTVFDVGREDGHCYLVLDYIPGASLEHALQGGTYSPDATAKLIAKVAKGLHYSHKKGFVHRDLKPGNILLDEEGEPRITDFGLAVSEESQRQLAGQVAGTPAYMSPEQVRGDVHHLDGRSDIWALGVILYEMVTGRHPFWRGDVQECIDEIQRREPKPPRQIDDTIPAELERIILKCLSKDVTARYTTADDLKHDLDRFRVGSSPEIKKALSDADGSDVEPEDIDNLTNALRNAGLFSLRPQHHKGPPRRGEANTTGQRFDEDLASSEEPTRRKFSAKLSGFGLTLSISVTALLLIAVGVILVSRRGPEEVADGPRSDLNDAEEAFFSMDSEPFSHDSNAANDPFDDLFDEDEDNSDPFGDSPASSNPARTKIVTNAIKADVAVAIAKAKRMIASDPASGERQLQIVLQNVRRANDLERSAREQLVRQLQAAIQFIKSNKGLPVAQLLETAYNQKFSGTLPQLQITPAFTRDNGKAWQPLTDGSVLTSKDAYRLNLRLDHDCFVYVWQVDSQGKIFWLYPQNPTCDFSSGSNPSLASKGVQLPPGSSDGFELDDTVGIEHLYVAASPARWDNLEQQLLQMANKVVTKGKVTQPFALKTRGVKGIRRLPAGDTDAESSDNETSLWIEGQGGAVVQEIWFKHVQDSQ